MSLVERISVIIDGSANGAIRSLTSTGTAAQGMTKHTGTANVALSLLNRTGLQSTALGQKFTAGVNQSGTALGGLSATGLTAGKVIGVGMAASAAIGGAALAQFALEGVSAFEQATSEVRTLSRVMGTSTEDASRLRFAAKALGIDLGAVEKGATIMAKSIGAGTSKLGEYGIEVARTKDGNVDMSRTIINVAEAFQATDDPTRKAAIGAAAFGKGWKDIGIILGKSKQELKDLYATAAQQHQIFSAQDAEQGRRLSFATRELKSEITGLQIELASGLVPALADATSGLTDMIQQADAAAQPLGGLGPVMGFLVDNLMTLTHWYTAAADAAQFKFGDAGKELVRTIPLVGPAINNMTSWLDTNSGSSDKAAAAALRDAEAEQERKTKVDAAKTAIQQETQALQGFMDIELGVESARRALDDATASYTKALWEATAAGGKDAEANEALDDATFALKEQINATAVAVGKKAEADAVGKSATEKAAIGNAAYRAELEKQAQSSIPAVKWEAQLLLNKLDELGRVHATAKVAVDIDISGAQGKLTKIEQQWARIAKSMGPMGQWGWAGAGPPTFP